MATVAITTVKRARGVQEWKWSLLLNGDVGAPIDVDQGAAVFGDKTVHVKDTFSVGGTIVIEGSNDGVTYVTLTDPQDADLSFTAESIQTIEESPLYIRPRVTAGDGSTSLTCIIVGRAILMAR